MNWEAKADGGSSLKQTVAVFLAVALAAIALFALSAEPASAARAYDSEIPDLNSSSSVAFDANGNAWVSDGGHFTSNPGQNGLYKYDPYPSQTILNVPNTFAIWSYYSLLLDLAVNHTSGELFVAKATGRSLDIFDENGIYSRSWSGINGTSGNASFHVAIDNSNTYSKGRVYLSLTSPENDVEVFDAARRPVEFPATASYIKENKLTGTPSGPFGAVGSIAVNSGANDSSGNIYVADTGKEVVDEFDSTGTFLRTLPGYGGIAVDPTNGNVLIEQVHFGGNGIFDNGVGEFDSSGNSLGTITQDAGGHTMIALGDPAVNPQGYLYVPAYGDCGCGQGGHDVIDIFKPATVVPGVTYKTVSSPSTTSGTLNATIAPNGGGSVNGCRFEYGLSSAYSLGTLPCSPDPAASPPGSNFTVPTDVSAEIKGLTTEATYHYRAVATSANGVKYGADQLYTPHHIVGLRTDVATNVTESGATLNGSLVGDGTPTHYLFEWGLTNAYGNSSVAAPGADLGSPSGPAPTALSFDLAGLQPFTTYHYRVVATGGTGTNYGEDQMFTTPPGVPKIGPESVSAVHSDRAVMHAQINPNGADTAYHFEYVSDSSFQESGFDNASKAPLPESGIGMGRHFQAATLSVDGLAPGTVYHYRAVATNSAGVGVPSADRTFKTYRFGLKDICPNAHVRQQTGAALLFDCRAYELASAANAGGYDVESGLVPGQMPFVGYPQAMGPSQLLYGVHNGGIPNAGSPTNLGVDPYVATRGENGWTTRYVGIPASNPFASAPFASTLDEADARLSTFAFGGPEICSPCFSDGSAGQPIHLPDGRLVQGMAGSMDPGPGAEPSGYVGKRLSADGRHFIFGSTAQFEPDGNSSGDISIYDRDLKVGVTHVVSKTPGGATMTGSGIGELDISANGSRIVIGQLVSTDSSGNRYWHLYMNVGDSTHSIDLTPGATNGVLYDGMTADGARVFFTTQDQLTSDDTDSSADIFRADVSPAAATITRVSTGTGGAGNTDSCSPSANTVHTYWNSVDPVASCDAVAVGGGGGVASGDGSIYLFSPETLDASDPENQPVEGAPNLYVARPGSTPHFIRTLESSSNAPLPPAAHPFQRSFGAFANPAGVAIDHSNGDVYVFDIGTTIGAGSIQKFDSSGRAVLGFGINGKLVVSGVLGIYNLPTGIAIDNDPSSPNYRHLFVPDFQAGSVRIFDPSGAHVSDINISNPTAVAVNPSNGNIYVTQYAGGLTVFDSAGKSVTSFGTSSYPTGVAVDSGGRAYVVNGGGSFSATGTTEIYGPSGTHLGQLGEGPSYGVAVDPTDDHVYANQGDKVVEFDSSGDAVGGPFGSGLISGGIGLAANGGTVDVTNHAATNIVSFGPAVKPADPNTDNPVVVDSVSSPATRYTGDFQVSPSGDNAVFTSTLPLSGYDNVGHREIFRYDAPTDRLDCASCNSTGEPARGDATLAAAGLSLSDDGRVFFDSTEGLVDRDLNNRTDAYEWESGNGIELISTGTGALAAGLLGVSADGTDAYFFTRDTLVTGDENGSRVKVYDARAFGGFPYAPPEIPCKASDECHGAGSQAPPPPNIGSIVGKPIGNAVPPRKCKQRGKCHRRTKHKHQRNKNHHRRAHRHG